MAQKAAVDNTDEIQKMRWSGISCVLRSSLLPLYSTEKITSQMQIPSSIQNDQPCKIDA